MDTSKVLAFDRACRLNELVLRNLTLKVEPRLVDTLVAHARGEAPARPKPTSETLPHGGPGRHHHDDDESGDEDDDE
jgi:hypothetical protein